jgi:hypothetical protein
MMPTEIEHSSHPAKDFTPRTGAAKLKVVTLSLPAF